jgi:NADH-quinone oxidoreductase subunit L
VQNDIKRVLAYSTVSQLGYMFLAMGVGAYAAGIFHLYTHAFFKALLFLGSGAVIHALAGEQDLRHMGGLKSALPLTYWTFVVGALAIAGVPGLSGFFSKDDIMSRTLAGGHPVLWAVAVLTSLLTAIYMFRVVYLVFHGAQRAQRVQGAHGAGLHDAPPAMALALVVLAAGSGLAGYIGFPAALGGSNRIERFLEPSFGETRDREDASGTGAETVHPGPASNELALMVVSGVTALAGIGIATFFFVRNRRAADGLAARVPRLHRLLVNKYWVDEIYDAAVVQPARALAERGLWKGVDVRVIDGAVNGVGAAVSGGSEALRRIQNGSVRVYAASLFLGVVAILGYYLWR